MNVEKIHKLASDIEKENKINKITNEFQNVISTLQNVINQPQQAQHQTNLSKHLENLYGSLDKSLVNDLSPAWYQLLVELQIDDIFGIKLSDRIKKIIATNNITPASAKQELDRIYEKLNNTISAFTQLTNGFNTLSIGLDELAEGECEIGILIPRNYIDNSLEGLKDEIGELNFILKNFSEFFTGEKKTYELRTLSTTDPLVTVGAVVAIAAGLSKAVGYLIDNYKKLLEIKKLKIELKNQGVSNDSLKGIEEHCNNFMTEKIDEFKEELKADYDLIKEEKRKNEILNGIGISLNKLANRIDQGFNFEVRVNPPETEETENDDQENSENQYDLYQEIRVAANSMQFLKTDGDPILKLPEKK